MILDSLLAQALQQPSEARKAFLDERCGNDADLRSTLDRLLSASDGSDPFLKQGGALDGPLWEDMLAESLELGAGARLGRYEIRGPIGAGGMGEVYRAHDLQLARDVAIKILPRTALATSDALARFEREARAVAALNHPNILAIHDVGAQDDVRFVVTELLEGETLGRRLADGRPLTMNKAVEYGIQIARGLAAAHDRGIVHRDLKPENVFITRDGRLKILDFGVALYEEAGVDMGGDRTQLTRAGVVLGTVGYTSPEQMLGKAATARSDLFAFGVVMHEMLTGTHPFERATAAAVQAAVLRDNPPSILLAVPDVTPVLVRLVERCLQKEPADRPETARDVAFFLEALAGSEDPRPVTSLALDARSLRQLRARLLVLSCGLLLLLTATTWGYLRVMSDRAVREVVEDNFARAERNVRSLHSEQIARLGLTARLVASFPELKALFATDVATIEDFLLGYQQRIANAPVLVALRPDGTVLGRTEEARFVSVAAGAEWLASLLATPGEGAIVIVGNRPYFAVAVASEAGGTVFGYLVAAEPVNQMFAEAVSEATQDEVVLLSRGGVLASTFRPAQTPWRSLEAWHADGGRAHQSIDLRIESQRYTAREVTLTSEPPVSAILVKSRDDVAGPYRRLERGVLVIGLVALTGVMLAGAWFSRWLTARR